jgi:hypothetical protein
MKLVANILTYRNRPVHLREGWQPQVSPEKSGLLTMTKNTFLCHCEASKAVAISKLINNHLSLIIFAPGGSLKRSLGMAYYRKFNK